MIFNKNARYLLSLLSIFSHVSPTPPITTEDLFRAARKGDTATIGQAIEQGMNMQCLNEHQRTPLAEAAAHGKLDATALLFKATKGKNYYHSIEFAVGAATKGKHHAVLQFLLENANNIDPKLLSILLFQSMKDWAVTSTALFLYYGAPTTPLSFNDRQNFDIDYSHTFFWEKLFNKGVIKVLNALSKDERRSLNQEIDWWNEDAPLFASQRFIKHMFALNPLNTFGKIAALPTEELGRLYAEHQALKEHLSMQSPLFQEYYARITKPFNQFTAKLSPLLLLSWKALNQNKEQCLEDPSEYSTDQIHDFIKKEGELRHNARKKGPEEKKAWDWFKMITFEADTLGKSDSDNVAPASSLEDFVHTK
jgi:hypothetical protein